MDEDLRLSRFSETTEGITVTVTPIYLEHESYPVMRHYMWAYHVNIENNSPHTVQLLTRHWVITDGLGQVTEVKGDGVVGDQPTLKPGDTHEYSSSTYLNTSSGIMKGTYQMIDEKKREFDIVIPTFSLDSPEQMRKPN